MSYFWYYAGHSIWNQLRKLFKTWVLIFLVVCIVLGGLIGLGIGALEDMKPVDPSEPGDVPVEEPEEPLDPVFVMNLAESIAGGLAIVVISLNCINADKNGSAIFQPADACILFTSPLKPQSVLLFRMVSLMGTMLLATIYMGFQIPNLVINLGFTIWSAIAIIIAWLFVLTFGQLLKTFIYMITATKVARKKFIAPCVYTVLAIIVLTYIVYFKTSGLDAGESLFALYNNDVVRLLPIFGWIKGIIYYSLAEDLTKFLISIGLCLAFIVIFVVIMWSMKVDFYEDAMAKTEETAALMAAAQENGGFAFKKKERSDKIKRDNFNKGFGANVYFFKSMYNRKRFATLGFFTKTSFTYLVIGTLLAALTSTTSDPETVPSFTIIGIAFGVIAFYRSLGNPLEKDTQGQYFVLIPESIEKKMFWSVLGSTTDCFLDLIPGAVVATIILGSNPIHTLAWIVLIASVDLYATIVGVFINLSVPVSAGKSIKQVVQIMFIYFGLLPDVALIAVGIVTKNLAIYAVLTTLLNFLIFALFFALAQNFIDPKEDRAISKVVLDKEQLNTAKAAFSRSFMMPVFIIVVATLIQLGTRNFIFSNHPEWLEMDWFLWLYSMIPMYLVGLPLAIFGVKDVPNYPCAEKKKVKPIKFVKYFLITMATMYVGSILGSLVTLIITELTGLEPSVAATKLIGSGNIVFTVLFAVIIGPIVEELVFRKFFIDKTRVYGRGLAIATSAIAFGLYHGNITQGIYATLLGFVLGYIYESTGNIRVTIGIHMCVNFMGGVVSQLVIKGVDVAAMTAAIEKGDLSLIFTPGNIAFGVYMILIVLILFSGLFMLFLSIRKIRVTGAELEVQKKKTFNTAYVNLGFVMVIATFVFMTLQSFGLIKL